ncbi:MAG: UDP-glucose 4-epimerase GalE [Hyphomicrobiales bacterium]
MSVLVTGGAGYIGSHMVHGLCDVKRDVVVIDNLSTGYKFLVPDNVPLRVGDIGDGALVKQIIAEYNVHSVVHFAGSIIVPESVTNPLYYYENNTVKSRALIAACVGAGIRNFLFSSTAAVYGIPESSPVNEVAPLAPISPYGSSKLMTEWMLRDTAVAHDFNYVALRYFNVAGADVLGRSGQASPDSTHLIKIASQAALGERDGMQVFGKDYDTPDGTCIRDYIHVTDLIAAHIDALNYLQDGGKSDVFNCGYGRGFSVLEVISAVERASGKAINVTDAPRRAGDPPELVANAEKIHKTLGWMPRHENLNEIVASALSWEEKLTKLSTVT